MPVLTAEEMAGFSPVFRGKAGQAFARGLMHAFKVDGVNALYDRCADKSGVEFATAVIDDQKADYMVGNARRLLELPEGPFITVSNHPYGVMDGIMLVELIGSFRPAFKVMVNSILARVKALSPNFITVIPTGKERTAPQKESISGIRQTLTQLRSGEPVGLFPSGAVSDLKPFEGCIRDREWQEAVIRLIQKARVPVVPVRFFDGNSRFYYLLGLISSSVRLLRLPAEALNKGGKVQRVGIGETVSIERQAACKDIESLRNLLRSSVYDMPLPQEFTPRHDLLASRKI